MPASCALRKDEVEGGATGHFIQPPVGVGHFSELHCTDLAQSLTLGWGLGARPQDQSQRSEHSHPQTSLNQPHMGEQALP